MTGSSSYEIAKDIDITLMSLDRYDRVLELAANGEIEVQDWKKHGELDALYIHASPAWVQKNINNPINSPIWDPIFFSQAAVESLCALCDTLNSDPDMAALGISDIALYTGITRQNDVWDECLRWLTQRGIMNSDGTFSGSKNRPTLVWADGRTITMMVHSVLSFV